jgi:phosphatidylglycerol lysyltransferase
MTLRLLRRLTPFVGLVAFALALFVLHRELHAYRYHDLVHALRSIPSVHLFLAGLLALLSYTLQTGYDALGLRYAGRSLPYRRTALASFVGYAFSNTVGLAVISAGSVRLRLYSGWGLSAIEIAKVIGFCSLAFWSGFLTVAGTAFLIEPVPLPPVLHVPVLTLRPLGAAFLAAAAAYVALAVVRRRPVVVRGLEFPAPTPRLVAAHLALSCFDWLTVSAVLYTVLPPMARISFPRFMGMFLLAQIVGVASQVPGGLGVFETSMLVMLGGTADPAAIAGSLLAFRVVYYLLPLAISATLLGVHELVERREGVRRAVRVFGRWAPSVVPQALAIASFVGGVILLLSGATPTTRWRAAILRDLIPLPVMELSHFVGSVAGAGLVLLAQGLQRRLDVAYLFTAALLSTGIVVSLLKGLDYEEAIAMAIMLTALIPCRRHFYRKASLTAEWLSPQWLAAVAIAMLASVWLGFFSYKHVEYSGELWWRFAFSGDAPRFLRATVGVFGVALLFAVARLLRTAKPAAVVPEECELEQVRAIVAASPHTYAQLALLGDKRFLLSDEKRAFVMYGVQGRSWVALGDPVGPGEAMPELVWRFRELADHHDGWAVFYEVSREHVHLYLDVGLTLLKLGEEARVPLAEFSLEGRSRKWLRHVHRRLEGEGYQFEIVPPVGVGSMLPELKAVSDAWLAGRRTREKGFSLGFFSPNYLIQSPVAVVRREGRAVAFANVWLGGARQEVSIDLMRHVQDAPAGIMDFVFVELMLWGSEAGFAWFNLGMAPLSGLPSRSLAPFWMRLGALVFRHGEHFYNFQGLRQFKEKFEPVWESRYLASPGGLALPRIVANVAALIGGGMKGVVAK